MIFSFVLQLLGINQVIPPVMDPLTPDDPLWKLLGQSRPVELRPDFVRNVLRAARQTPQDKGWLASLKARWQEASWTQTGLLGGSRRHRDPEHRFRAS